MLLSYFLKDTLSFVPQSLCWIILWACFKFLEVPVAVSRYQTSFCPPEDVSEVSSPVWSPCPVVACSLHLSCLLCGRGWPWMLAVLVLRVAHTAGRSFARGSLCGGSLGCFAGLPRPSGPTRAFPTPPRLPTSPVRWLPSPLVLPVQRRFEPV